MSAIDFRRLAEGPCRHAREDRGLVGVLALLALLGLVGLAWKLVSGADRTTWGYVAGVATFLLSTTQMSPIVAMATRLAKGHWGRPLRRATALWTAAGLVVFVLYAAVYTVVPSNIGRWSIWFYWPWGAPHFFDLLALAALPAMGLALLHLESWPDRRRMLDITQCRAAFTEGGRRWLGSLRQWNVLSLGVLVLGIFYFMWMIFLHLLVSSDLGQSMVPGWRSAIFPAYHAVTGLQGGVAVTLVTLYFLRKRGYLLVGLDQFWGLAKLLLALSLFFFYFTWADFLTFWYGRQPQEVNILTILYFGPHFWLWLVAVLGCFVLPFGLLIWNKVRVSVGGPFLVGIIVLIGNFADRMRIYLASFSASNLPGHVLEQVPPGRWPDFADVVVVIGALAGAALAYLLAMRIYPAISLWEVHEGTLLEVEEHLVKARVRIIAKPK